MTTSRHSNEIDTTLQNQNLANQLDDICEIAKQSRQSSIQSRNYRRAQNMIDELKIFDDNNNNSDNNNSNINSVNDDDNNYRYNLSDMVPLMQPPANLEDVQQQFWDPGVGAAAAPPLTANTSEQYNEQSWNNNNTLQPFDNSSMQIIAIFLINNNNNPLASSSSSSSSSNSIMQQSNYNRNQSWSSNQQVIDSSLNSQIFPVWPLNSNQTNIGLNGHIQSSPTTSIPIDHTRSFEQEISPQLIDSEEILSTSSSPLSSPSSWQPLTFASPQPIVGTIATATTIPKLHKSSSQDFTTSINNGRSSSISSSSKSSLLVSPFDTSPLTSIQSNSSETSSQLSYFRRHSGNTNISLDSATITTPKLKQEVEEVVEEDRGEKGGKKSQACDFCRKRKVKCNRQSPSCRLCLQVGIKCTFHDEIRKPGPFTRAHKRNMQENGYFYDRSKRSWKKFQGEEESTETSVKVDPP